MGGSVCRPGGEAAAGVSTAGELWHRAALAAAPTRDRFAAPGRLRRHGGILHAVHRPQWNLLRRPAALALRGSPARSVRRERSVVAVAVPYLMAPRSSDCCNSVDCSDRASPAAHL